MSIFKTIGFQQVFNTNNTPMGGIDRFGLPIKQLMLQLNTNTLYILDENNNILPISANYATRYEIQEVKKNINSMFHYKGWKPEITTIAELIKAVPNPKPGDVYAIGPNAQQYVYVDNEKKWQPLGTNIQILSSMLSTCFIGKGSTIKQLSGYIAITDWNALISICSGGIQTALDIIIQNKNQTKTTNFDQFFTYCINTGITASSAFEYAQKNYNLIKSLSTNLSTYLASSIISELSGDICTLTQSIVTSYAPSKLQLNTLSGNYNNFVANVLTRTNNIQESLSSLQYSLDNVNTKLSSVYTEIKL